MKTCKLCKNPTQTEKSQYCSYDCRYKKFRDCRTCPTCRMEFNVEKSSPKVFCSKKCMYKSPEVQKKRRNSWELPRELMNCQICNIEFMGTYKNKYCSRDCWNKLNYNRRLKEKNRRKKERKSQLVEFYGGKCISCGYDKSLRALNFHHRNPEEKSFRLSDSNLTKPWQVLIEESKKCDLLCANCHQSLHEKENLSNKIKSKSQKQKDRKTSLKKKLIDLSGGCCKKCNLKSEYTWCMTFHHIGDKEFELCRDNIYRKRFEQKMLEELKKCELLCFNCHMEEEERLQDERSSITN